MDRVTVSFVRGSNNHWQADSINTGRGQSIPLLGANRILTIEVRKLADSLHAKKRVLNDLVGSCGAVYRNKDSGTSNRLVRIFSAR